jgi:hypothetical protein
MIAFHMAYVGHPRAHVEGKGGMEKMGSIGAGRLVLPPVFAEVRRSR